MFMPRSDDKHYSPHAPTKEQRFTCSTCGVFCTSEISFQQHINGVKHGQNVKRSARMANGSAFEPSKGVFSFEGQPGQFSFASSSTKNERGVGSGVASFTPSFSVNKSGASAVTSFTPSFSPDQSGAATKNGAGPAKWDPPASFSFATNKTNTDEDKAGHKCFEPFAPTKPAFSFESPLSAFAFSATASKPSLCVVAANKSSPFQFGVHTNSNTDSLFCSETDSTLPSNDRASMQREKKVAEFKPSTETEKVRHNHVGCDGCGASPLVGMRYRCSMWPNYDLCERCIVALEQTQNPAHDPTHLFLRIAKTTQANAAYPLVANRCNAVHRGITCDGCSTTAFRGYRYRCQTCPDLDFCEACEAKGFHDISHPRIKMSVPGSNKLA